MNRYKNVSDFYWKLFSLARLRQVTPFSAGMMANQLLWILVVRVQDLFISGMHGAAAVGQYRTAWRMIELIGQMLLAPIGSVSLVTLSTLQHDAPAFASAYRRLLGGAALVGFPLLFGFGAVARELTAVVFGAKWSDTGQIAEVLIFIAVPFVLNYVSGPALAALNKSGTILVLSAVTLGVTVVLTYFALPHGLIAVAMAYVLRTYVTAPVQQLVLCRRVGIAPAEILRTLSPPLLASLLMAGILWLSKPQLVMLAGGGLPFLCLAALLGGILYAAGLLCCGRRHLVPYFDLVRTLVRRFWT
jgi:O-antigen/teichoic acid export membrane protein